MKIETQLDEPKEMVCRQEKEEREERREKCHVYEDPEKPDMRKTSKRCKNKRYSESKEYE